MIESGDLLAGERKQITVRLPNKGTTRSSLGECIASWLAKGEHLLVGLESYFDGSSADGNWTENGTLITLAGFAAEDDIWVSLDAVWNSILKDTTRRPSAPYLHMRELLHRKGPFKEANGWDLTKRSYLVSDLLVYLQTIDKKRFRMFACTIDLKAYRAYKAAGFSIPDDPLRMCNNYCPYSVLAWYATKYPGLMRDLHYFFDKDEPFKEPFENRWKLEKANNLARGGMDYFWSMIKTITTAEMRDKPALQAADLLAWCSNRDLPPFSVPIIMRVLG